MLTQSINSKAYCGLVLGESMVNLSLLILYLVLLTNPSSIRARITGLEA